MNGWLRINSSEFTDDLREQLTIIKVNDFDNTKEKIKI